MLCTQARHLLSRILEVLVAKLASMRLHIPALVEATKAERAARRAAQAAWQAAGDLDEPWREEHLLVSQPPPEKEREVWRSLLWRLRMWL